MRQLSNCPVLLGAMCLAYWGLKGFPSHQRTHSCVHSAYSLHNRHCLLPPSPSNSACAQTHREDDRLKRIAEEGWDRFAPPSETNKP